eukprot:gb/GEZN01014261.1/.p1 GENE.gb/GEZN01014261.1/~~gb/GEZN01014261.1/.p1  ORF type:complete len:105 (+),score=9.32 gb/GEZN01014261.1/:387-701(+)
MAWSHDASPFVPSLSSEIMVLSRHLIYAQQAGVVSFSSLSFCVHRGQTPRPCIYQFRQFRYLFLPGLPFTHLSSTYGWQGFLDYTVFMFENDGTQSQLVCLSEA